MTTVLIGQKQHMANTSPPNPDRVCLRSNVGSTFHGVGHEYIPPKRNPNTEK